MSSKSSRPARAGHFVLALAFLAMPAIASADWMIAGFVGASHTMPTTLQVTPDAGTAFELPEIEFIGKATKSPIYYGYRVGWLKSDSPWGIEAEFTHAKTIAVNTNSATLTAFEQSHGLNFVLGNVTYRSPAFCTGRCVGVARAGAGLTIPHVEAIYLGNGVSSYQYGGPAVQGGAGLEIGIHSGFTAVLDGRLTYTKVNDDLAGAKLSAPFTSWHFNAGLGWKFR